MEELLERLGRPQDDFLALHVAGTRGKGSTCALLSGALEAAGVPAGLTSSPDLVSVTERIRIRERDCSEDELRGWAARVREAAGELEPSYFEILMAAAFVAFSESELPLAVVEVGLGGRLDASVLCNPAVTAVTRLGLEHQDRLGDTIELIAAEKAGIFKPGVPAVLAPNDAEAVAVVAARAAELGAPLRLITDEDIQSAPASGIPGAVQRVNAAVAWAMLEELACVEPRWTVSHAEAETGFGAARWPARLDRRTVAGRQVLIDVAHDAPSVGVLLADLESRGDRPEALVFTCLADKSLDALVELIASSPSTEAARIFVPEVEHPRARPAVEVVDALRARGLEASAQDSVQDSFAGALQDATLLVAFGSFAVAGGVMRVLEAGP